MEGIATTRGALPVGMNAGVGNGLGNNAPRVLHAVRVHPNCMTPRSRDLDADPSKELPQLAMQGMCWQTPQPPLVYCSCGGPLDMQCSKHLNNRTLLGRAGNTYY